MIPSFLKRVDLARPGRRVVATTSATNRDGDGRRRRPSCFADDRRPSRRPTVDARRLRPRRRGQGRRRDALPVHRTCPRRRSLDRVRAHVAPTSGCAVRAGLRRRAHATAATSRAGPSSASTTASTCCPTTAPSATCSATACSPSSGSRSRPRHGYALPEAVDEAGLRRPRSTRRWTARPSSARRRWPSGFPDQAAYAVAPGLPGALLDAAQRPRGDAPARAAHRARRATRRTGAVVPGDAPAHRRAGRAPRRRRA